MSSRLLLRFCLLILLSLVTSQTIEENVTANTPEMTEENHFNTTDSTNASTNASSMEFNHFLFPSPSVEKPLPHPSLQLLLDNATSTLLQLTELQQLMREWTETEVTTLTEMAEDALEQLTSLQCKQILRPILETVDENKSNDITAENMRLFMINLGTILLSAEHLADVFLELDKEEEHLRSIMTAVMCIDDWHRLIPQDRRTQRSPQTPLYTMLRRKSAFLEEAMAIDPQNPTLTVMYAGSLLDVGEHEEAFRHLQALGDRTGDAATTSTSNCILATLAQVRREKRTHCKQLPKPIVVTIAGVTLQIVTPHTWIFFVHGYALP